jgi:GTPase SAR1 family protein
MIEETLMERAIAAFDRALQGVGPGPESAVLRDALLGARAQIERPMTVAVVGRIKAGKSTMTNALLGAELAPTGPVECTYNVNWFHYAPEPELAVRYTDGRIERRDVADLDALTRRALDASVSQKGIDYLDVRAPRPILQRFSLVDTPGLDSAYVADSQNTMNFIGAGTGAALDITARTQREARNADAVLYLFSRGLASSGAAVVEEFQGPAFGRATPLNAIGVLTKVDGNWRDVDDPVARGVQSAEAWMREPAARRLFFAIRPVCAKVALGAATLEAAEFETIRVLAARSEETLRTALANARRFATGDDNDIEAPARAAVLERLGQYGVILAARAVRSGAATREDLARELGHASGMTALSDLIVSHFGSRALLIKLERSIVELRALALRERNNNAAAGDSGRAVDDALDAFWTREHGFAELAVLRRYYEGALELEGSEEDEMLRVTGESGTSVAERLGESAGASPQVLLGIASRRIAHWSARAEFAANKATRDAAKTIRRSYERLAALARASGDSRVAERV